MYVIGFVFSLIVFFVEMFIVLLLLLDKGHGIAPTTGVYSSSGQNYSIQLEMYSHNNTARFEFFVNTAKLIKYFEIDKVDYSFNEVNNTISFFEKPHLKILEVRNYLLPLAEVDVPFVADWTEDGDIVIEVGLMIRLERGKRIHVMETTTTDWETRTTLSTASLNKVESGMLSTVGLVQIQQSNMTSKGLVDRVSMFMVWLIIVGVYL